MKYALLRGLWVGVAVALGVLAIIEATIRLSGPPRMDSDWQAFLFPAFAGLQGAFVSFVCHPLAPKKLKSWIENMVLRVSIGFGAGFILIMPAIFVSMEIGDIFGLKDDHRMGLLPPLANLLSFLWISTIHVISTSAMAAGVTSAIIAPSFLIEAPLLKWSIVNAVAGILSGAWSGLCAGLFLVALRRRLQIHVDEDWLATVIIGVGLLAGIVTALYLRFRGWRRS